MSVLQGNSGFMRGRMQPCAENLPNTVKTKKESVPGLKTPVRILLFSFVREYAPTVRRVLLWRVL